ncbi:MAG: hypothetical protein E6K54_09040 [Gammaproteobacteria bacterium]|nr:MAG: hypothetical protein E6K54_09040 [Gammaproteobacteria bacterium]
MENNKTLKQIKPNALRNMQDKVLIFSSCEKFIKKFTDIFEENLTCLVKSKQNMDLLIPELFFSKYHILYLDIDSAFHKLNEILTEIKEGKNKSTETYFAASKENSSKFERLDLPENIILRFLDGEEILDSEGSKCTY